MLAATMVVFAILLVANNSYSSRSVYREIQQACHEAANGQKNQVVKDFTQIAAKNPGYLAAADGAMIWAGGYRPAFNFIGEGANVEANHSWTNFYALCGYALNLTGWK